ncbi:MAG: hypothetical protein IK044_07445 [Methanobrevibacter sp.]|nr:hypothetical protein [Methanobrevibacter sp.]
MKKVLFLILIIFLTIPFSFAESSLDDAFNTTDSNIHLDSDTYLKHQFDAIEISKDLNVTGSGIDKTIIDGAQTQILSIKSGEVVISDLTFMNADFDGFGGAISNNGTLTLKNVRFINNSAFNCGAIDNMGRLQVIGCEFINNSAYGRDAGALSNVGVAEIQNSTFISNIAYRNAGAIKSQGKSLTVRDSIFIANKAVGVDSFGGAFYTWTASSAIENCEFIDNYAANFGGAIFSYGGQSSWCELSVRDSNFFNNTAGDAGGIYAGRSNFTINYSRIVNTTLSIIHNYVEDISCNWWGENNPVWEEILTDTDYEPQIYATLNLTATEVNLYWNNTSENALIDHIKGTLNGEEFTFINGKYTFKNLNSTAIEVIVDMEVQKIDLNDTPASILEAGDVEMYYHDGSRFYVKLMDEDRNPLVNETVYITLNNVTYSRKSDENGSASLSLNLGSGKYLAQVLFNSTDYKPSYLERNILIKATINASDVVKVFKNETQYYATFLDNSGNYLANGTVVRFNINGVLYNRQVSGDKGLAKLNINLNPGEYVITAINPVTGEEFANNIVILSRFSENSDIVKYYRNATQYTVKVIGDDGKAVGAGENVTFNINGVFYTRQSDENGTARLSINLPPGDYVITAKYRGCMASNNICVLNVLSASDISMSYRDGTKFKVTLLNGQGKPFSGQNINFNVNGVFYTCLTGADGVASLNINLPSGKYIITSTYNYLNIANKITIN